MRICTPPAAALALCLLFAPANAAAGPSAQAGELYAAGDFIAAANLADDEAAAGDLAFAARALLAACVTAGHGAADDALLDRAEQAARRALALDRQSVEARLQLAVIYGLRSKRATVAEAFARHYAPHGRRLIDEAIALAPENARAHALLGAWHLEVLRRGGRLGALTYGARLGEGLAAYERAMALDPGDAMIPLHFAVALIDLDGAVYAERARRLLARAAAAPPRDALGVYGQRAAAEIAAALAESGPRAAQHAARARLL